MALSGWRCALRAESQDTGAGHAAHRRKRKAKQKTKQRCAAVDTPHSPTDHWRPRFAAPSKDMVACIARLRLRVCVVGYVPTCSSRSKAASASASATGVQPPFRRPVLVDLASFCFSLVSRRRSGSCFSPRADRAPLSLPRWLHCGDTNTMRSARRPFTSTARIPPPCIHQCMVLVIASSSYLSSPILVVVRVSCLLGRAWPRGRK